MLLGILVQLCLWMENVHLCIPGSHSIPLDTHSLRVLSCANRLTQFSSISFLWIKSHFTVKFVLPWLLLSPILPTAGTFKWWTATVFYAMIPKLSLSLDIRQKWENGVQHIKICSGWNYLCMRLTRSGSLPKTRFLVFPRKAHI